MSDSIIKLVLMVTLIIAALSYLLVPRSRLAGKIKMTTPVFITTNIIGIICGIFGILALYLWPDLLIVAHLWELIILPYVLVWVYWLIIVKIKRTTHIIDEKQEFNMSQAAGATLAGSILIMAVMFNLSYNNVFQLNNGLWFPFYLFTTITLFSIFTVVYFVKE